MVINSHCLGPNKVDLVSSHSDNERDIGPLAAYSLEGSAVSELYNNDRIPSFILSRKQAKLLFMKKFLSQTWTDDNLAYKSVNDHEKVISNTIAASFSKAVPEIGFPTTLRNHL